MGSPGTNSPAADSEPGAALRDKLRYALRTPTVGPLAALAIAILVFSVTTDTFLAPDNLSLVLQQSIVIGTLALGQSLIILTAGIDLANGAIAVLSTIVMAKLVFEGESVAAALLLGLAVATCLGLVNGLLVARLGLPSFIVTLGALTVVYAVSRLYSDSRSYPVTNDVLVFWGNGVDLGGVLVTWGTFLLVGLYAFFLYVLNKTAWGRHIYAVGNASESARLTGINVRRTVLSVYVTAGLLYGIAAWQALGRIPNADPNSYQTANLESITAVVIGGTSLFGGRGSVAGTLIGTLIVTVLRSGLTQAGIDSLYQDVATGTLVVVAVGVDKVLRRGSTR
ncbi:ABC transporter permease [Streptomyces sp. DSM 40750]|uniref:ABC transporter permease n=1 Tax=Streptomyces sp. DSM 40750 TaxID=2801030 RepID=UPI00214CF04A|nr:ABC transporter permease [Streptomyces sp. DSM 40750]UUU24051.1 ABC transporter permease [Streptomyces sp. DSM 40750]